MGTNSNGAYHIHISSKHKWFDLKLKEVWRYKDLIWLFTKRSFTLSYKQTVLGPIWLVLNPFLSSVVYTFLFGGIIGMSTDGVPHILFYLCTNSLWGYFAGCLSGNASTFTNNAGVFGKVYFPRLTTPISNVLASIIRFFIQLLMVFGFLIYFVIKGEVSPNWYALVLLPLTLIHLGIMGMGFGIIISSFTTKYRDLVVFVSFGVTLWMYGTPVIYPLSQLSDGVFKNIIIYNPVTPSIEIFRFALLGKGEILLLPLLISWIFTVIVAVFGIIVFNRVERTFMDTV